MTVTYRLGALEGDGIGPEIVSSTVQVMDAALAAQQRAVEWKHYPMGLAAIDVANDPLPPATVDELGGLDGWLLGPHDSAAYPADLRGHLNPSGLLRIHYDLFANVRPARTLPGTPSVAQDMDLVIARENTEGFYADRNMYHGVGEFMPTEDVALSIGVFTRHAASRIAHEAFRLATDRRGHVTVVHKANVLRQTTGLFLQVCAEVASEFPQVELDDMHVDAMAAHLVRRPADFDVIVTENMFGDILSDLTAELSAGLGVAGSLNAGHDHAMAQAAHGSAPDIGGRDVANPVGMLTSGAMLLNWLGSRHDDTALATAAETIHQAIIDTLAAGDATQDLGGSLGTRAFADAVYRQLPS